MTPRRESYEALHSALRDTILELARMGDGGRPDIEWEEITDPVGEVEDEE